MPYIREPKWVRYLQEGIHLSRYFALALAGTVAIFRANTIGLTVVGYSLVLFSLVAMGGVITRRFPFELVALWFVMASISAATLEMLTLGFFSTGILIFCLIPNLAERLLYLSLIAKKEREKVRHG